MPAPVSDRPDRRRRRWPAALLVGVATVAAIGWLERRPVIRHFVDDGLARAGVPARYTLADVGLGRQRLTEVSIGDPAHPDLTADWIETEVGYGLNGATLTGVRAGHVQLAARLVDGRVTLGSIDRLLPAGGAKGGAFLLPAIALAVEDGRLRLATPVGAVSVALRGSGRLDGGFAGRMAAIAPALRHGGCAIDGARLAGSVRIGRPRDGASVVRFVGPARWRAARCDGGGAGAALARIDATLSSRALNAALALSLADPAYAGVAAQRICGTIRIGGAPAAAAGRLSLAADRVQGRGAIASRVTAAGRYTLAGPTFDGTIAVRDAALPLISRRIAKTPPPRGTPATPLLFAAKRALVAAMAHIDTVAAVRADRQGIAIDRVTSSSRSGVQAQLAGTITAGATGISGKGRATLRGGGMPSLSVDAALDAQQRARATITLARYAAGGAAIAPASFVVTSNGDRWRAAGRLALSGPLGAGRVEALTAPIDVRGKGAAVAIAPGCTPVAAARLTIGSLDLRGPGVTLCPTSGPLASFGAGGARFGARLLPAHLGGALGGSALSLSLGGGTLSAKGFGLRSVAATLGPAGSASKLVIDRLDGAFVAKGVGGRFDGAGGHVGAVPLALSGAAGDWRFADGVLTLSGVLRVADAASPAGPCAPPFGSTAPRFCPLEARDVRLTLADGAIDATGSLVAPGNAERVAAVTLHHDLALGRGHAGFAMERLTFTKDFQPDRLTPATFGIVADVSGAVSGSATIDWSKAGVTSGGRFTTDGLDLAAAFGPVTGISGTIVFDDLLALATPPGQTVKVAGINPGVAVNDGVVTYRLRPGSVVDVAGARWPFAGGTLTLDPTVLDLAHPVAKRLTFRVGGMQAAQFLQQFDFKNLDVTGTFDGVLPMVFDESGGRIENGRLTVRPGGGTIAYVGDLTEKDLGFWGNIAFQALRSLRYRNLDIAMNGPLAGEMVTGVRFAGVQQGKGAKANFLVRRLQKLPFVFNITIRAPFRGLIDSAQSFYDPRRLVDRLVPPASGAVQPPESPPRP